MPRRPASRRGGDDDEPLRPHSDHAATIRTTRRLGDRRLDDDDVPLRRNSGHSLVPDEYEICDEEEEEHEENLTSTRRSSTGRRRSESGKNMLRRMLGDGKYDGEDGPSRSKSEKWQKRDRNFEGDSGGSRLMWSRRMLMDEVSKEEGGEGVNVGGGGVSNCFERHSDGAPNEKIVDKFQSDIEGAQCIKNHDLVYGIGHQDHENNHHHYQDGNQRQNNRRLSMPNIGTEFGSRSGGRPSDEQLHTNDKDLDDDDSIGIEDLQFDNARRRAYRQASVPNMGGHNPHQDQHDRRRAQNSRQFSLPTMGRELNSNPKELDDDDSIGIEDLKFDNARRRANRRASMPNIGGCNPIQDGQNQSRELQLDNVRHRCQNSRQYSLSAIGSELDSNPKDNQLGINGKDGDDDSIPIKELQFDDARRHQRRMLESNGSLNASCLNDSRPSELSFSKLNHDSIVSDDLKFDNARRHANRHASMPNIHDQQYNSSNSGNLPNSNYSSNPSIMADYITLKLAVAELQSELQVSQSKLEKCESAMSESSEVLKRLLDLNGRLQNENGILRTRNAKLEEKNSFVEDLLDNLDRLSRLDGAVDNELLKAIVRGSTPATTTSGMECTAAGAGKEVEVVVQHFPSMPNGEETLPSPTDMKQASSHRPYLEKKVERSSNEPGGAGSYHEVMKKRPSTGSTTASTPSQQPKHDRDAHREDQNREGPWSTCTSTNTNKNIRGEDAQREETAGDEVPEHVEFRGGEGSGDDDLRCSELTVDVAPFRGGSLWRDRSKRRVRRAARDDVGGSGAADGDGKMSVVDEERLTHHAATETAATKTDGPEGEERDREWARSHSDAGSTDAGSYSMWQFSGHLRYSAGDDL